MSVERVIVCVPSGGNDVTAGSLQVRCRAPDGSQTAYLVEKDGYVVSPDEYIQIQKAVQFYAECSSSGKCGGDAASNPFVLSAEEGALISVAVISCWATAWAIRAVINVVKGSSLE